MISLSPTKKLLSTTQKTLTLVWNDVSLLLFGQGLLLFIRVVFSFLGPAIFALVLNYLIAGKGFSPQLNLLLAAMVFTHIFPHFLGSLLDFVNKHSILHIEELIEVEFINLYSTLDVAQQEDPKIKDQINKVTGEGQWRIRSFIDRVMYFFENIVGLFIASAVLFRASWWTLPLLLIATVPEFIVSNKYGRNVWSITSVFSESRRIYWNLRSHFTVLPNLLELKLFQNLEAFRQRVTKLFSKFLRAQFNNEKKRLVDMLIVQTLAQLANSIIIIFFIYEVVNGNLLVGTLTFLITTISRFRSSLSGFFGILSRQYEDSLYIDDFFELKALPRTVKPPQNPITISKAMPTIEFQNVSFRYPDTKKAVLKNITFTLKPGEKLALVGVNGVGKTTLVKLLCRFYDPTSGDILINGHNLKNIDLDSWYHHLGILFQQYAHYDLKVKEAISVGRSSTHATKARIIAASKHAGTHDFIKAWPKKYNQQLGKEFTGGKEPSIGQWQKLALARVFYRNPSILILDEPTSSLDAEAEAKIFKHLDTHEKNKSAIFISHRFSTVRNADKIFVIKDGLIAEQGSHQQLMEQNKIYARLFNLQAKSYQK